MERESNLVLREDQVEVGARELPTEQVAVFAVAERGSIFNL